MTRATRRVLLPALRHTKKRPGSEAPAWSRDNRVLCRALFLSVASDFFEGENLMRSRTVALFVACLLCAGGLVFTQAPGAPTHVAVHAPATWTVTPSTATIPAGSTVQLVSSGGNGTTWSSSDPSVATVSASGLVTGVSEGTVTILARKGNKNGVATITVTPSDSGGPVDCVVSDWSAWSACINDTQTRTRTILTAPANGGAACPALSEQQSCSTQPPDPSCTITAASVSQSDVQTAVSSAVNGDVVCVPAGSATWSGNWPSYLVQWSNKNLTLRGAGIGQTVITCDTISGISGGPSGGRCLILANDTDTNNFSQSRVTGFTFRITAPSGQAIVYRDQESTTTPHTGWRIDHNRFWYDTTGSGNAITIQGATYGVIDHNVFDWKNQGGSIQITSGQSYESAGGLTNPVGQFMAKQPADLGSANFLFIEDNTFTGTGTNGTAVYDSAGGGGRAVFRYNTVTAGFFNHHWIRGLDWCGILAEIYRNTFTGNTSYSGSPVVLESGTALIFENQITGHGGGNISVEDRRAAGTETSPSFLSCDGTHAWDGNAGDSSAPGWPCLGQIGRAPGKTLAQIQAGDKQTSLPLHLWLNGADPGCAIGGSCTNSSSVFVINAPAYIKATPHSTSGFGNGDVDFINGGSTPKVGYTPYTYPHPLTAVP